MTLLLEHQLGAGARWTCDRDDRGNPPLARSGQQADPGALAVADDGDALGIDVLPFLEPADDRAHVLGEVTQRGGLRSTAALPVAALVVANGQHSRFGNRSGQLRQCRDALDHTIAVADTGPGEQHDRREFRPWCRFGRPRQRRADVEASRRNDDRLVTRVRIDLRARCRRGDVLAHDVQ